MKHSAVLAAAAAVGLGSPAAAQTIQGGWEFRVSNVVSPSQPTATVEVWAWFDFVPGVSEVWGGGDFDLVASEGDWPAQLWVFPFGYPTSPPSTRASSILGVSVGQIHIPALGLFGDPSNPIHVFSAGWTTTDFSARTVSVVTENTSIFGVWSQAGAWTMIPPSSVVPGSSSIYVVPSPAGGGLAFVVVMHCFARRRRERTV